MITTLIYSGNSITIKFDTAAFYMNFCSKEQAEFISNNKEMTLEEVRAFLEPSYKEMKEKNSQIQKVIEKVTSDLRYYFKDGALYRVGIPLSIPQDFAESIYDCIIGKSLAEQGLDVVKTGYWDDQLERLDNLWKWTSLIRTPKSRESFYSYVAANHLIVTRQGFVIGFRRADRVRNTELNDLVKTTYERLRKNKKSTNVNVWKCGYNEGAFSISDYGSELTQPEYVGNLKELYHSDTEEVFESSHRSTFDHKKLQFRIGVETRLPENEVEWNPDLECSPGIHGHSGKYEDSGYGDTRFAFVMNPRDTAAAPYRDNSKFRMIALTPLQVLEEGEIFTLTEEHEQIIQGLFESHISNLEEMLESSNFQEFQHHALIKDFDIFISIFNTVIRENKDIVKQRLITL